MSLSKRNLNARGWVVVTEPRPNAALRLICCPYAGAGAHVFRSWATRLPAWIEVLAVEPPGRGSRYNEPPARSVDALVASLATAIAPTLDRPYAIFGHSFGALVGFELARLLRRWQCRSPRRLFVAGRGAPSRPRRKPPIHELSDPEFLLEIDSYNGWPEEVRRDPELVGLLLPIIRADFALIEGYEWRSLPMVDCDVSAYYGLKDVDVPFEDVQAWGDLTSAQFKTASFEGDHFFLRSQESELLKLIVSELSKDSQPCASVAS